jgi:hypothetical protein
MYDNMAKVHGISRENHVMSLKRTEWQQPANILPPLNKYLSGQRRRRVFGAFPETENDASIVSYSVCFTIFVLVLCRKLVGEFCRNTRLKYMNVRKWLISIHYQKNINFPIGLLKVFINLKGYFL